MGVDDGAVRLQSDGTAWRPLIHVEDMAGAIAAVLAAPRDLIHAEAFNAGASDANYVIRDLALMVADAVTAVEVEFAQGAGTDPRSYKVDFSKIAETLDAFQPVWDAAEGARQLVDAYRAAGMDEATFSGDRFMRLSRLKTLIARGCSTTSCAGERLSGPFGPDQWQETRRDLHRDAISGAFVLDLERREDTAASSRVPSASTSSPTTG